MQIDALAVELRPRPMPEAVDLGVRLVQANARSVWFTCWPVFALVGLASLSCFAISPWLPGVVLFWLKPWTDRSVLFVLSRALFGQSTRFVDLWRAQRQVWWQQLLLTLTVRRLSPWRSYTQPVYQLEGQAWRELRQRRTQLLRGRRGVAGVMQFAFANIEFFLAAGLIAIAVLFAPAPLRKSVLDSFFDADALDARFAMAASYAIVVTFLEPFFVAAGFAMYLNRRVELEAWDVEQEFRRAF